MRELAGGQTCRRRVIRMCVRAAFTSMIIDNCYTSPQLSIITTSCATGSIARICSMASLSL